MNQSRHGRLFELPCASSTGAYVSCNFENLRIYVWDILCNFFENPIVFEVPKESCCKVYTEDFLLLSAVKKKHPSFLKQASFIR